MATSTSPVQPELISLEELDRRHILRVVEHCHGNRTNAAQVLEIDRKTLYRKLLRWGFDESGAPSTAPHRAGK